MGHRSRKEAIIENTVKLTRGAFWLIDDRLLAVPYSDDFQYGVAKSGNTYNHKLLWEYVRPPKRNNPFDYYPRGRVDFTSGRKPIIYMNVTICSREGMEQMLAKGLPKNTVVISFSDPVTDKTPPENMPLDFTGKCSRFFQIQIHGIDLEILEEYKLTYDTYFPEAPEAAKFIYQAKTDGLDIICQCEYGQSRSAACAAAILEHFTHNGISIFADYRYCPNQMVYHKVFDALNEYAKLRK